jgi:hypothetical protein
MYPNLPKDPEDVICDFDDMQMSTRDLSLAYLYYLKGRYPKFKATLFTIPARCTESFLNELSKIEWLQLAVHGWDHHDNYECSKWTKEECHEALEKAEKTRAFVLGFKAPGWQISDGCYQALIERGYWVADQAYNNNRRPAELNAYLLTHPWCVHGHTWDIRTDDPLQRNGIRQMIEERSLSFTPDTKFHYISELFNENTGIV